MNKFLGFLTVFLIFCTFQTIFAQNSNEEEKIEEDERPQICTGGVRNSATTYFPQPEIPKEVPEQNISGVVTVRVSIDEEGNVTLAKACSGNRLLRPEAEKAAMKAKFKPTKLSGVAVKVSGLLIYNFNLQDEKAIFGGIVNGRATYLPAPDYPKEAEIACAGGKVEVEVLLNEQAKVISAKAISGNELLRDAAVEAAKKAKFRPMDVVPIKLRGIIVYNFEPKKCINAIGIVNKKAVNLPKPNVTNIIQPKHLQIKKEKIVAVQIVIDIEGNVIYEKALSGHQLLRAACENSAHQTKFRPTIITGQPIKIKGLLAYKFKPDGTVETDIERDDKDVIGTPINLVKPPPPFCNCRFGDGGNSSVFVEAKIDGKGNVTEAKAVNGHPILKNISEKAALESKFLPTNIRAKLKIVYKFEGDDRSVKISDVYVEKVEIEKPLIVDHMPVNSKPLFMPQPEYTGTAKAVGAKGEVKVEILIDENGNVEEAKAVSGHPLLRNAAEKAALQTIFKPNTLSGSPVKTKSVIVFIFN